MLKPIAHLLVDPQIWYFNRKMVASAFAVGVLIGFMPIPFQMLLAAVIAIMTRVNLPVAVITTWVSNPLSMAFIYTANYYIGCWLLRIDAHLPHIEFSLESMLNLGGEVLVPLFLGSVVAGTLVAAVSFLVIRGWWRYSVIKHYRTRKIK